MSALLQQIDEPFEDTEIARSIHATKYLIGKDDRPVVIDFRTDSMEHVYPMVPAGLSNDEIRVHPSQTKPE